MEIQTVSNNRPGGAAPGRARFALGRHALAMGLLLFTAGCPLRLHPGCSHLAPSGDCDTGAAIGAPTVSFAADVLPVLENAGCLSAGCHGGAFPSSNYSMASYQDMFVAGDEAMAFEDCPIVPGDPDASYLFEKISPSPRTGARMPFLADPLSDEEIELIRTWIAEGAANN